MLSRFRSLFVAAAIALLLSGLSSPPAVAQTRIDERHPLAAGGRVEVENIAGSVRVRGWDRDEVEVTGSLGEGQRLEVDASTSRVSVRVVYPDVSGRSSRQRGAELVLRVPKASHLQATVVSAGLDIAEVELERLHVRTISGRVEVAGRAAEAELVTVSGNIQARLATRRFRAETVSGGIDAGGGIGGDVSLQTVSGAIRLSVAGVYRLRGESVSGRMSIQPGALAPGGRIGLESVSGGIDLRLPADTSAQLRVSTFSGGIQSNAGEVERPGRGPGRRLSARLGGGDGDVSVDVHSGNVSVQLDGR